MEILALICGAVCIGAYLYLANTGKVFWFNLANAVLGWPILIVSIELKAYHAALLNLFFTLVGIIGLVQGARTRETHEDRR